MSTNGSAFLPDSETGKRIQEKLQSEKTLQAIDHLLDRIDTLENAVERLTQVIEQGPGLISIATDSIDEVISNAKSNNIDLEKRTSNALAIAEKLTSDQVVEQIKQFAAFTEQAPGLISIFMDTIDELYRKTEQNGIAIQERIGQALELVEKLTNPNMSAQINQFLTFIDQAPGLVAMGMDVFDESYKKANELGVDLPSLGSQGISVLQQLNILLKSEEFQSLMQSGMLSPDILKFLALSGNALVESQKEPSSKIGLFGMLRALNDTDRQKAIGFLMKFAKSLGKHL